MTYLLSKGGICSALKLTVDEVFASIMAAAVHDVAHPGVNNAYLIESNDLLAIRYNDKSPLESMHAAFMFEAMCDPAFDALKNCSRVRRKAIRRLIVSMVLATDNANHTEYLSKLNTRLLDDDRPLSESRDDKCLCLQIVLHTSDVSNPAKDWDYYVAWTDRIMEEFYAQGDAGESNGIYRHTVPRQNEANTSTQLPIRLSSGQSCGHCFLLFMRVWRNLVLMSPHACGTLIRTYRYGPSV